MKKRILAVLLAAVMLTTAALAGAVTASAADSGDAASKYVTLDGEWHFKLYRTYQNMYQYFAYYPDMAAGSWSDEEAAKLPEAGTWQAWETVNMPGDNPETGGLLTNLRPGAEEGSEETEDRLLPTWSEAWVVRTFELPADFTEEDTVTLLLGIIDDNDVVYINGQTVAASGFLDGNGETLDVDKISETGGFDYTAENAADQVKWEKSYWEIEREYAIPANVLKTGENEIAIRVYNNNGTGGFYSGHAYAICGNDLAVRSLKGLPTQAVEGTEANAVKNTVETQIAALKGNNIDAYAATVSDNYHNDADVKADRVAGMQALLGKTIEDTDAAVYKDEDGYYWYSATRTVDGTSAAVEVCFEVAGGKALERGNWNRCYGTGYTSALFGQDLTYSVYLPPSYYEKPDQTYPTVWLLHGRGSSSTSYRNVDHIGDFMDAQIEAGNIMEMVLIMPDSGKLAFYEDTELGSSTDESGMWRTQLVEELREVAEKNYRLLKGAAFRGLTGNSMGAYGSIMAATTHPELYSSAAMHMGYLPDTALDSLKGLTEEQLARFDFYLDAGNQDDVVGTAGTIAVHDYLQSVGKAHGYELRDGGHNSAFYMAGMAASMKMHSDHFKKAMDIVEATIGDTYYYTLAEAVEAVRNNETITLLKNVTLSEDIVVNRAVTFTLDKGEYDITGGEITGGSDCTVTVDENGVYTVTSKNPFKDVSSGAFYYDAVLWAVEENVTKGTGDGTTFSPDENCTRAQFVTFLWRAAGSPEPADGTENPFSDVSETTHKDYYTAILWAVEEGVTNGTGDGTTFSPGESVKRAQAVTFMYRYALKHDMVTKTGEPSFSDVTNTGSLAPYYDAIGWAVADGITNGLSTTQNTFGPMDNCNRGQMITFLHRLFTDATA